MDSDPKAFEEFKDRFFYWHECGNIECDHSHKETRYVINWMKEESYFPTRSVDDYIEFLKSHGGYCDCEVLLNVVLG